MERSRRYVPSRSFRRRMQNTARVRQERRRLSRSRKEATGTPSETTQKKKPALVVETGHSGATGRASTGTSSVVVQRIDAPLRVAKRVVQELSLSPKRNTKPHPRVAYYAALDKQVARRAEARQRAYEAQQAEKRSVLRDVRAYEKQRLRVVAAREREKQRRFHESETMRATMAARRAAQRQQQRDEDAAILQAFAAAHARDAAKQQREREAAVEQMLRTTKENERLEALKRQQRQQERAEDVQMMAMQVKLADARLQARRDAMAHLEKRQAVLGNALQQRKAEERRRQALLHAEVRRKAAEQAAQAKAAEEAERRAAASRSRQYRDDLAQQVAWKERQRQNRLEEGRREAAKLDKEVRQDAYRRHKALRAEKERQRHYRQALGEQIRATQYAHQLTSVGSLDKRRAEAIQRSDPFLFDQLFTRAVGVKHDVAAA